jgi:hypothetical protein
MIILKWKRAELTSRQIEALSISEVLSITQAIIHKVSVAVEHLMLKLRREMTLLAVRDRLRLAFFVAHLKQNGIRLFI